MRYFASPSFWECYGRLPSSIQELADRCFDLLKAQASHPSLHLKKVGRYWSVRLGRKYRALAVEVDQDLLWFWIGTHADYDKLIK
jgi:hypothetical protein